MDSRQHGGAVEAPSGAVRERHLRPVVAGLPLSVLQRFNFLERQAREDAKVPPEVDVCAATPEPLKVFFFSLFCGCPKREQEEKDGGFALLKCSAYCWAFPLL